MCLARGLPLTTLVGSAERRVPVAQLLVYALAVAAVHAGRRIRDPLGAATGSVPAAVHARWPSPGSGRRSGSAVAVTSGAGPVAVEISVANHSNTVKDYEVVPAMRDARWGVRTFDLAPGATWRGDVRGRVPKGGCLHRLLVSLRESGASKPIGSLTLWFHNGVKLTGKCTR